MMLPLYQVGHVDRHVVTEVIEAELVVGTEGDVAVVCLLPGIAVRLVLVDAVHRKSVEHIKRSHPLRVTLGQIVVDGDHMHTLAGKCVQEYRQGCYEGLSFTCRHLRDLTLMEHDAADELHVVVDHVPGHLVATGNPVIPVNSVIAVDGYEIVVDAELLVEVIGSDHYGLVLLEPASRGFHNGESLRKYSFQHFLNLFVLFLYKFVRLGGKLFLLVDRDVFLELGLDFLYPFLKRSLTFTKFCFKFIGLSPQFIVGELVDRTICRKDLVKERLDKLHIPVGLGAEDFSQNT